VQRIEGVLEDIDYHQFYVITEDEDADPSIRPVARVTI
jgi:hypothetical protein